MQLQVPVVQKWVRFNPGLHVGKTLKTKLFHLETTLVFLKYSRYYWKTHSKETQFRKPEMTAQINL